MLASAVLAWLHIRSASIWYDEVITLLTVSGHPVPDWSLGMQLFKPSGDLLKILSDLYHYDVHPPLYFWVLALWRLVFGASLEAARSLSAIFTLATLFLIYRYSVRAGMRWPSAPVVIYALSAAGIRYAYNARSYALACFLIVLTLLLAQRKSRWTSVAAAACVATHYFAALCVAPIVLIAALQAWKSDRRWSLWTAFSFAALCSPLTILVANHVGARPHQYPQFGVFRKELHALATAAARGVMPSSLLWRYWFLALILAQLLALIGGIYLLYRRQFVLPLTYLAFLGAFLLLAVVTHKSIMKMPNDYYVGVGAPLLALLLAYGIEAIPWSGPVLAAAIVVGTLTANPNPMFSVPDYRSHLAQIRTECPNCPIVAGYGWGGAVPACLLYESNGAPIDVVQARDTLAGIAERVGKGRIVYFFPTGEPMSADLENQFIASYASERHEDYFKVDTSRPVLPPLASISAPSRPDQNGQSHGQ